MKYTLLAIVGLLNLNALFSQNHSHLGAQPFVFPNIEGYVTLKTDLHMHSVFSDGEVWPTIRVSEALRENLDAISLTEHLEYQPHKEDIPHPDRNRAYHLALEEAKDHDLIKSQLRIYHISYGPNRELLIKYVCFSLRCPMKDLAFWEGATKYMHISTYTYMYIP